MNKDYVEQQAAKQKAADVLAKVSLQPGTWSRHAYAAGTICRNICQYASKVATAIVHAALST